MKKANVIVNKYLDYTEIVVYNKPFNYMEKSYNVALFPFDVELEDGKYTNSFVIEESEVDLFKSMGCEILTFGENFQEIDRTRNFVKNIQGILQPNKEGATIQRLVDCLQKSGTRALDTLKGYIQSNEWKYFVTLTFSPKEVDRHNKNAVNYLWQKYKQKLQYEFPDIKILLIPELHEKGGIHFHGFIGNADIDKYLIPAINHKKGSEYYGQYMYSESGAQIFNLANFKYGFTTICKIVEDSSKLQLAHYISKYVTKQVKSGVGYNQKRYYHTRNLDYKDKKLLNLSSEEIDTLLQHLDYTIYKDKNGIKVYHTTGELKASE